MMFSIVMPLDSNRLEQFKNTKRIYDKFSQEKEFIIPTRNELKVARYLDDYKLMKDVKLIPYNYENGFNPTKALNMGVRNAKYDQIIITSPEIKPLTSVLDQLEELIGRNVVCQVFDESETGDISFSLVNSTFRNHSPAFYFLAMYNKKDIEAINGWDEDFMKGYAYDDDDFGERWVRAGLPFEIHEEIQALHQYHPRSETIPNGLAINFAKLQENNANGVIKCINGLNKLE